MDTATIWTIIGTGITTIGVIYGFMRNFKSDINTHIDKMGTQIGELAKEMKEENKKMEQRVIETNKRMDGVYYILLKRSGIKTEES